MAALIVPPSPTTDWFAEQARAIGAPFPWAAGEDGAVFDANGRHVLTVDPDSERADDHVASLALLVELAVNTCAGLRATPPEEAA